MRLKVVSSFVLAALLAGCASSEQQKTSKEQALDTWNSTRATVLLGLARDQYSSGNFDKCRQTLSEALRMEANNAEIHVLLAKVDIEQGDLEPADAELQTARTLDPKLAEADYLSGVIYQRWQQPSKSLEFYQAAYDKAPTELAYLMAKAETLVAMDRQADALKLLQDKVTYFEHSPVIRDAVGMLLVEEHQYDAAVQMFRRATILTPDDLSIREHLALASYQDGQYADAADTLTRLFQDNTLAQRSDLQLTLAQCQFSMGQAAEARRTAQTACDLDESNSYAWLTLAKISLALGDQHRTQAGLDRALALAPDSDQAYLLLGYLRLRQNRFQEALNSFNQAANLAPRDGTTLCMIGYTLQKLSRPHEAAAFYAQALKLDPKDNLAQKLMADTDSGAAY
jgi:tetratricopeptide (TPR) repeat protein